MSPNEQFFQSVPSTQPPPAPDPSALPPPTPAEDLCRALLLAQEDHHLFPPQPDYTPLPVVVGVSGGADSVCLLHLLARFAPQWNLALHVAHLDHNVRPDSSADGAFVEKLARNWGIPFHSRRLPPAEIAAGDNNLEAALRSLRYAFLAAVAATLATHSQAQPVVAVAHTADDQAETILMHLLRGSGLAGLAGMRPSSPLPTTGQPDRRFRLVRPLLGVPRTHILQYLNAHQLAWREDPSNQDLRFRRNRLRHEILPALRQLYPNLTEALTRLGAVVGPENERAEQANRAAFHSLLQGASPESGAEPLRAVLDRAGFRGLDIATQRGVVRHALAYLGLPEEEINFERVESVRGAIIGSAGAKTTGDEESPAENRSPPTPLAGEIAWSATAARFSLHRQSALAFAPDHPTLDRHWRAIFGAQTLPVNGELLVGKWKLTCRELDRDELPPNWNRGDDPWQVYCDALAVGELLLTPPRRGQAFAPLGMEGRHKQLGDFFTDCKVPVPLRQEWPLLLDGSSGGILWVCGLRLSHHVRIRPETEQVFHLKWSKR